MSKLIKQAQLLKAASQELAQLTSLQKSQVLKDLSKNILSRSNEILEANKQDLRLAQRRGLSKALQDRLLLNDSRLQSISRSLFTVSSLPDPIGEVLETIKRPNGLIIKKVRVPFGVIAMIYEARPNVTPDAFALAFKAGSAILLKGGSDALYSNEILVRIIKDTLLSNKINEHALELITDTDRKLVKQILELRAYLNLIIPRGGVGLIKTIVENATVPVIETGAGVCHIYIDRKADLKKAVDICYNAKVQRPSVCNAVETLLVHQEVADKFLPEMLKVFFQAGVEVRGNELVRKYDRRVKPAKKSDWGTEYLALIISIKVVQDLPEALAHIAQYSTKHSEAILSEDPATIRTFTQRVDAAAVLVNASTRFTDGGEFGFGCEIGISTQKMHARGPMGLRELTTYKYLVYGHGQIRN
jgi:glutamate-5-semialdehyde dehydrogenase